MLCYIMQYEDKFTMCVNFCRLFVSFELHAVSITRRFLYTRFPPLSLLHADSITHVSVTRAFSVPY